MRPSNKLQAVLLAATMALAAPTVCAEEQKSPEKKQETQAEKYQIIFKKGTKAEVSDEKVSEKKVTVEPKKESSSPEEKQGKAEGQKQEDPEKIQKEERQTRPKKEVKPGVVQTKIDSISTKKRKKKVNRWNIGIALGYSSKGIIRYTHNKFFDSHTINASLSIKHNRSGLYIGAMGMSSPEGGLNNDSADRSVVFGGIDVGAGLFNIQLEYQYIATTPTIWGTDLIKDQHDVVIRIGLPPALDRWFLVQTLAGYNANAQEETERGVVFAGVSANLSILVLPEIVSKNQFDIDVELVGRKTVNYTPKTNISSSFRVRLRNILAPESLPFKLVGEANYLRGLRNDNRSEEFWFGGSIIKEF